MTRLTSRSLLISQTPHREEEGQNTLFNAFNSFRQTLKNMEQAKKRALVLQRQIQKNKSQRKNKNKHADEVSYVQQMAQLDRQILRLNELNKERSIQKLKELNIKNKKKNKLHCREVKSQLQSTKTSLYQSTEKNRIQNERFIMIQNEKQLAEKEIQAMKQKIREKRRANKIMEFYHDKIEEIRHSKEKEMSKMIRESRIQDKKLVKLLEKNARMRIKKDRSLNNSHLKSTQQTSIKNVENHNPETQTQAKPDQ